MHIELPFPAPAKQALTNASTVLISVGLPEDLSTRALCTVLSRVEFLQFRGAFLCVGYWNFVSEVSHYLN
jgi:hypothetical protein